MDVWVKPTESIDTSGPTRTERDEAMYRVIIMTTDRGGARMKNIDGDAKPIAEPGFRARWPIGCFMSVLALLLSIGMSSANAAYVAPKSIDGATTVTADELIEMAATMDGLVVIDARKSSDWKGGHIDGTVHVVNNEMTEESLLAVATRDQPVVFYCNGPNCYRSGDSCIKAVQWGWRNVYWFRGGIEEWTAKGYPLTK